MSFPSYSRRERIADGCVHVAGIGASLVAMAVLLFLAQRHMPAASVASVAVYAAGALSMFIFSAGYNLVGRPRWKEILRRCDHAAIFIMIAGTYTPFAVVGIGGAWGLALLAGVWAAAVIGIALKLMAPSRFERVSVGLYLLQGWAVLVALDVVVEAIPTRTLVLLGIGGGLYTAGVAFHLWRRLAYQNAIWHGFVLCAAAVHYAAIIDMTLAGPGPA